MAITTLSNVKTALAITGNTQDARISALIPMVESDYLNIRNKPFNLDIYGDIEYPAGSELTAIKMISWQLNNTNSFGKTSESLGDYSVSYQTNGFSEYPASITGAIKKYVGAL